MCFCIHLKGKKGDPQRGSVYARSYSKVLADLFPNPLFVSKPTLRFGLWTKWSSTSEILVRQLGCVFVLCLLCGYVKRHGKVLMEQDIKYLIWSVQPHDSGSMDVLVW